MADIKAKLLFCKPHRLDGSISNLLGKIHPLKLHIKISHGYAFNRSEEIIELWESLFIQSKRWTEP